MHPYFGDITLGTTHDFKFNTAVSGMPTTLAGSPVISAYVGNGTTEITAGITLTVDIDGRVGLHNIRVVATSGNGFATATDVDLVVTVGTVGGSSVVPMVAASFSIEHRSSGASSAPTAVEIRTEMDSNSAQFVSIIGYLENHDTLLEGIVNDVHDRLSTLEKRTGVVVADGGNSATSFKTDLTEAVTNFYRPPQLAKITSGALAQQNAKISGYNGTTKVLTFSDGFTSTPADGVTFEIIND